MTELPDDLREFVTGYLELRLKAYMPCTRDQAVEAGHCRSTHGSNNHRHYSLVQDHGAWALLRRMERRIKHMNDDLYYYFNQDLQELRLRGSEKKLEEPPATPAITSDLQEKESA